MRNNQSLIATTHRRSIHALQYVRNKHTLSRQIRSNETLRRKITHIMDSLE